MPTNDFTQNFTFFVKENIKIINIKIQKGLTPGCKFRNILGSFKRGEGGGARPGVKMKILENHFWLTH